VELFLPPGDVNPLAFSGDVKPSNVMWSARQEGLRLVGLTQTTCCYLPDMVIDTCLI